MKLLPFEYAVRNLGRRPLRTGLGVCGSILVVGLVVASSAFVRGMQDSLTVTGTHGNVILLGTGSEESIERSQVDPKVGTIVGASLAGIRSRLGVPFVSPEIHVALAVRSSAEEEEGRLTVLRGMTERAFLVHPQVQISAGRAPEPGRQEIAVGPLVAAQIGLEADALGLDSKLWIDNRAWTICGLLSAPHTVMDGEIWMPISDLQIVSKRRTLSCVVLTLASEATYPDVEAFAAQRLDLEITAMLERDYYTEVAAFMAPIRGLIVATSLLIALGGVLGGLNTMYAAFASRARELGSLQVLGFHRAPIMFSLLQESLLMNAVGTVIGVGLGMWLLDGVAIRMSMGAFGMVVDSSVVTTGLVTGLLLGILGAVPPAWRCLRLSVSDALRS